MDMNKELKLLLKLQKKMRGGGSSPVQGWGSEWMRPTKMPKKKVWVGSSLKGGSEELKLL